MPHETKLMPPRPGTRHVRVVQLGIVIADDRVRRRVERFFHWPMIILALLVLPLLAIEFFLRPAVGTQLWWISLVAMSFIWLAFLIEFCVKISVAECRLEYARRNWLDILIILLPILRPLRVATLAKTTRIFTLRGVGMKFARSVFTVLVGLEATNRLLNRVGIKTRQGSKDPAEMTRYELMDEVKKLRGLAERWEAWHEQQAWYVESRGVAMYELPTPTTDEDIPAPDRHPMANG